MPHYNNKIFSLLVFSTLLPNTCMAEDVSVNLSIFSDLIHRGVSISNEEPGIKMALNKNFNNGLFVGSNLAVHNKNSYFNRRGWINSYLGYFSEIGSHSAIELSYLHYQFKAEFPRSWDYSEFRLDYHLSQSLNATFAVAENYYGRSSESYFTEISWQPQISENLYSFISVGNTFNDELSEKEFYIGMGETAENLAKELSISREDQEGFSINSHKKALKAQGNGRFDNEIFSIDVNGESVNKDEGPREPNIEKIKSLNPAFDANGTITPATSSPISIGASMVAIANESKAKELGIKAKFRILGRAVAGVDWKLMGSGPLPATEKVLKKCNMTMSDIDVIELNEAFAAQSLYVIRKGQWNEEKINLNGGAIALGHPLGCSGTRIIITLMNVMEQNNLSTGLATMCIGTGQGIATIIERV